MIVSRACSRSNALRRVNSVRLYLTESHVTMLRMQTR